MKAKEMALEYINNPEVRGWAPNIDKFRDMILKSDTYKSMTNRLSSRPELQGSEKQIAWAKDKREKFIEQNAWHLTVTLVFMWEETLRAGKAEIEERILENFKRRVFKLVKESKITGAWWWIELSV